MRWARWFFVAAGPVLYWSLAACEIVSAREELDVFAWVLAVLITTPVSFLSFVVEPAPEWHRAWFTLWTATGAEMNGLLMMWIAWRITRPAKQSKPNIQQNTADYDDSIALPGSREAN
jgi:hypothetical protein